MNFFQTISGTVSSALQEHEKVGLAGALSQALQNTQIGGLGGLIDKLNQAGLGNKVASWLSNNPNLPISVDELRTALGNQQVQQIAREMGIPIDKVLPLLAEHLPSAVDQSSPDGTLHEPAQADPTQTDGGAESSA